MARNDESNAAQGGVSEELDALSCDLLGSAIDALAAGSDVLAVVALEDEHNTRISRSFINDTPEACIEAARNYVQGLIASSGDKNSGLDMPVRYALVYEGAVENTDGAFDDALILEFAEKGTQAYSAYVLWDGFGAGENLAWTDPAPAGEVESLF